MPRGIPTLPPCTTEDEKEDTMCEFAFHHDVFNSYIERRSDDTHVLGQPSLKKLSRKLCFVLRWGAPSLQLHIQPDGYVTANDLRRLPMFRRCTDDVIRKIVERDGKSRFAVKEKDDGELQVRANHGHGIPGVEVVERELTPQDVIGYVIHATTYAAWSFIRYEGLRRGERSHIHFTTRPPQENEVVAGVRRGGEVCVYVDAHHAMQEGIRFLVAPSHVIIWSAVPGVDS